MTTITTKSNKTEAAKEADTVDCIAVRRIGVEGHKSARGYADMAEEGEKVSLPRDVARKLQESGAIKIEI